MKRIVFLTVISLMFMSDIKADPKFSYYKGSSSELRERQREMDLNRQFNIQYNNRVQMNNGLSYDFNYESATKPVMQSSYQYVNQSTDIHGSWYTASEAGGGGGGGGSFNAIQTGNNNSFARDMVNTAKNIFSSSQSATMNTDLSSFNGEAGEIDESFGGFTGFGSIANLVGLNEGMNWANDGGFDGPAPPSDGCPIGDALLPLGLMALAFSLMKFRKK
ncbi:MAG: hypothetical protein MJZ95_01045 [Paludibacteraceae bacterium]|nr:hypothetical protein [Paludibacteraceae bacterium]